MLRIYLKIFIILIQDSHLSRDLKRNQITIRAVQDISFTIKRGSIVGFIGVMELGKSTTIKMLTGNFFYPSSEN